MTLRRVEPDFQERVWGSTELKPWFPDATNPNAQKKIGEVWFEAPDVPLLIKFLFTTESLSVQVHPGDEYARLHHNSPGKTELWHVLAAEPGARIAAGFREPVTREQVRAAAGSGEIVDLLEWFDVSTGDTFFIPAGTVHAIGAGLTICEIQQRSDITYRIFDYSRERETHLDRALDVCHLRPCQPRVEMPFTCEYFSASLSRPPSPAEFEADPTYYQELVVLDGHGEIAGNIVGPGQVWQVASGSGRFSVSPNLTILRVRQKIRHSTKSSLGL
jgi:mannose-6-phosphate isomerase